jgi:hypothetical protein
MLISGFPSSIRHILIEKKKTKFFLLFFGFYDSLPSVPPSPTVSLTWGVQGYIFPPTIPAYIKEVHLYQATRTGFV